MLKRVLNERKGWARNFTSSWNGNITDTVGNFEEYNIFLHSGCLMSFIERFKDIMSEI